ncbi:MAG: hypothetical protein FH748_14515 [Balneolaceae bacterium]|nr:hypothetical protein [Balneolaceae bacterium]
MIKKVAFFCIICIASGNALAQTSITFNLNMKPMLEDSSFIPGKDLLKINGNLYPLGRGKDKILKDRSPIDSVYSVEISFPSRYEGEKLTYNFYIVKPKKTIREIRPRILVLSNRDTVLPPIIFNAFAW